MMPAKVYFVSDGCTANLQNEIIDKKTKEVSGNYLYEDGYFFRDTEVLLSMTTIEKLKKNNLIKTF